MILLLSIAAAASVLTPPIIRENSAVTYADYPSGALSREQEGALIFSVFVDLKGKPVRCSAERIVETDFTTTVCKKVRTGGFQPAKDRDGKPAYGFYRSVISFWLPEAGKKSNYPLQLLPEYSYPVKPVPGLLTQRVIVPLVVAVDDNGVLSDCSARAGGDMRLVDTACSQVKADWQPAPLADNEGVPRAYVRSLSVEFVPEQAKP